MDKNSWHSLPSKPGVYFFKDGTGRIVYVGKAKDLKKRVSSYFAKIVHDAKTTKLIGQIQSIDHIVVDSEIEAFLLEANLIKKHSPYYNIQFTDDKFYPFIMVAKGDAPFVAMTRKKSEAHAEYFGPYTNAESVKTVLKILRRLFPFQSVKNHPKRKCLYFHLHLCPCIPVFPENRHQYKKDIKNIKAFLAGKKKDVVSDLIREQKLYIKNEEFEKASQIQKKIETIEYITSSRYEPFKYIEQPDFYYERIKRETEALKKLLFEYGIGVKNLHRIECYDISNLSGKQATGSMVVFTDGDSDKREYRKFKIKSQNTPDDFKMHQEMMSRRLKNKWPMPDLFVIDGGKGQISSVLQVLVANNVSAPIIGLAKREETIVIPVKSLGHLEFMEIKLPHSNPAVNLLRRIRDESHRFAIAYHRLLRKKDFLSG